jgi:hypothetical protein
MQMSLSLAFSGTTPLRVAAEIEGDLSDSARSKTGSPSNRTRSIALRAMT